MVANENKNRLLLEAMEWFFCDREFEEEVLEKYPGISVPILLRDYIKRIDMALQRLADERESKRRSILEYWPDLLATLRIRKKKKIDSTIESLKKLDSCYDESNEEIHEGNSLAQYKDNFSKGIRVFLEWVAKSKDPEKEKIWLEFISCGVTKDTRHTRKDHHYLYLLLEAIYRAENNDEIYAIVSAWFETELRSANGKISMKNRPMENDLKKCLKEVSQSPDIEEKIYSLAQKLGFDKYENPQKEHYYLLQDHIAAQEELLPEVLHWGIEGGDSNSVDMNIQLGSKDQALEEFCGKPLKMALEGAMKYARGNVSLNDKPLLQIEFHPDLFFELLQVLADLKKDLKLLFREAVSGIVFAPLRHTEAVVKNWKPNKANFQGSEWYQLKPFDSEANHWDFSRPSDENVDDWVLDEKIYHAYLSDWNGIRDQWDFVCDAFWPVFFVGLGESESCFEGFDKESNLKLNEAVEILRNKQKRFSEAPVVLWQHEERKSEFSRQWEFSRADDLNAFCP